MADKVSVVAYLVKEGWTGLVKRSRIAYLPLMPLESNLLQIISTCGGLISRISLIFDGISKRSLLILGKQGKFFITC